MPAEHILDPPAAISVVVVTHNGRHWLGACLEAVRSQGELAIEIILVDNASSDGSVEFVRHHFPEVRVVTLDSNRGFAVATNVGCREAHGRYLVLLNNDTEVLPGFLRALRSTLELSTWADMAAARIVYLHDPELIDSAGDGYTRWGGAYKRLHGQASTLADDSTEVFGICGAACMIRRNVFESVGGFDDDFFMVHEDVDFSYRAQLLGHRIVYVPEAVVRHGGSSTLGRSSRTAVYYGQRNLEWVYAKNTPWPLFVRSLPGHLLYVLAAAGYFAVTGRLLTFLGGQMCGAWGAARRAAQAPPRAARGAWSD